MTDKVHLEEAIDDLHTVLDFVRWSVSRFVDADLYFGHGTDNPWDEALALVFHGLHIPHQLTQVTGSALYSARLTRSEKNKVAELVLKRVQTRLPLPYITHQAWFAQMPFYVDERVLIPRSPFAEIIEQRFEPQLTRKPEHILDMCTGGGCIAIALACEFEDARVDAVDISADALAVADLNIQEYGLSDRVLPLQSDLFSALQGQKYDLIVANPPYVDAEDMADLPPEFQHEPELALASGDDGLDLVEQLLSQAKDYLNEDGWCFVEVGNSIVHLSSRFPKLEIEMVDLTQGGHGIFAIQACQLRKYFSEQ